VDDLFTEDAIIQEIEQGVWWRGHEKINRFLGFLWKEVAYVPKAYEMGDRAGYIAGNLRTRGNKAEHWNFMIGLKKSSAGKWQIEAETFTKIPPPPYSTPVTAEVAIRQMDEAKVRRGVVLSLGYWYADAGGMRTENDWTVAEAGRYPDRLTPFCGVNPLKPFAIPEVQRCASIRPVKGIKIHLANAGINLEKPDHRAQLRNFVAAVNRTGLALIVHIRPIGSYTRADADNFIKEILPAAPDITIQIAHAANSTDGLTAFADAIKAGNPAVRKVIFDWGNEPPALLRRIGLHRFIFGTDMPTTTDPIAKQWQDIKKLGFTDEELRTIAGNVPPYLK
jgi:predicted TIM-barrel fold metal-dependent hydrolase